MTIFQDGLLVIHLFCIVLDMFYFNWIQWNLEGQDASFLLMTSFSSLRFPHKRHYTLLAKQLKIFLGVSCRLHGNAYIDRKQDACMHTYILHSCSVEILYFLLSIPHNTFILICQWYLDQSNVVVILKLLLYFVWFYRPASEAYEFWSVYCFKCTQLKRFSRTINKRAKWDISFKSSLFRNDFITKVFTKG